MKISRYKIMEFGFALGVGFSSVQAAASGTATVATDSAPVEVAQIVESLAPAQTDVMRRARIAKGFDILGCVEEGDLPYLKAYLQENPSLQTEPILRMLLRRANAHLKDIPQFFKDLAKEPGTEQPSDEDYAYHLKLSQNLGSLPAEATVESHKEFIKETYTPLAIEVTKRAYRRGFKKARPFLTKEDIRKIQINRKALQDKATANTKAMVKFLETKLKEKVKEQKAAEKAAAKAKTKR